MHAPGDQLKYALGIGGLVSLYGIATLFVYYVGPRLGLDFSYQIVLIALILLTLPFAILLNHYRQKRAAKAAAAPAEAAPGADGKPAAKPAGKQAKGAAPAAVYDELARGAEEAVQWLRASRLGGARTGSDAIYALPWFAFAGPPASGKTSLALASGLSFHTLPSQQRAEQRFVRPTRQCEWRVTDAAILLDTSGRYQTEGQGRDEWTAFLETVARYRKTRPLDGFVLVVNAAAILQANEAEIEQQAKILRTRLDEAMRVARARFPVYLVFTHADAIEGFGDFFRTLADDERRQVWGSTIPLAQAPNAHALFDGEFDLLYDAIQRRRLMRLGTAQSEPPAEQLKVFKFPRRLNEQRRTLGLFVAALFRPNPFSESPLLRGFYFTAPNASSANGRGSSSGSSGGGSPAAYGATQQLSTAAAYGATQQLSPGAETMAFAKPEGVAPASGGGNPFFTERFFKEVLLHDKDMAASFQAAHARPHRLRNALIALAALVLLALMVGILVSFITNRQLIARAQERGSRVRAINIQDQGRNPLQKDAAATQVELEAVERLREVLEELDRHEREGAPYYMRLGLYSGGALNEQLRIIYYNSISQRFYRNMQQAVETKLRELEASTANTRCDASPEAERACSEYYDLLKAYLMLAPAERREQFEGRAYGHVEAAFLENQLQPYWVRFAPGNENAARRQLSYFAGQAERDDGIVPHATRNDVLVAGARRRLESYPAINRYFKRITTDTPGIPAVSFGSIVTGRWGDVLEGTHTVPGAFTIEGYRQRLRAALDAATTEMGRDDWVMGATAASPTTQSADVTRLQEMYFNEYVEHWRRFLQGIRVRRFQNKDDAVRALQALTASDSPMEQVMRTVVRNTDFAAAPEQTGFFAWLKSWFSKGEEQNIGAGMRVIQEFQQLFPFVRAEGDSQAPMAQYGTTLRPVLERLENAGPEQISQLQQAASTERDEIGLNQATSQLNGMTQGFTTTSAMEGRKLLLRPVEELRSWLLGGNVETVARLWNERYLNEVRRIETGYPFTDATQTVDVTDLARVLNPRNGRLQELYNQRLVAYFDDQWRPKEGTAAIFSPEFITYMANARRLQQALFPADSQQVQVSYNLELQPVRDADIQVTIDGSSVSATPGGAPPSAPFRWPAPPGATSSGARITVARNAPPDAAAVGPATPPQPLDFPGPWGVFRMFERGNPQRVSETQYQLSWTVGGVPVRARMNTSATNPFQRQLFTGLRAPQNILR